MIFCPDNFFVIADSENCEDTVITWPTVTAIDDGPFTISFDELDDGRIYTVVDEEGNTASCSIYFKIIDDTPPIIECPANISINTPRQDGGIAYFLEPAGFDNCGRVQVSLATDLSSGSVFPLGLHQVIFDVVDSFGLESNCSFFVNVSYLDPVVQCNAIEEELMEYRDVLGRRPSVRMTRACDDLALTKRRSDRYFCRKSWRVLVSLKYYLWYHSEDEDGYDAILDVTNELIDLRRAVGCWYFFDTNGSSYNYGTGGLIFGCALAVYYIRRKRNNRRIREDAEDNVDVGATDDELAGLELENLETV